MYDALREQWAADADRHPAILAWRAKVFAGGFDSRAEMADALLEAGAAEAASLLIADERAKQVSYV